MGTATVDTCNNLCNFDTPIFENYIAEFRNQGVVQAANASHQCLELTAACLQWTWVGGWDQGLMGKCKVFMRIQYMENHGCIFLLKMRIHQSTATCSEELPSPHSSYWKSRWPNLQQHLVALQLPPTCTSVAVQNMRFQPLHFSSVIGFAVGCHSQIVSQVKIVTSEFIE